MTKDRLKADFLVSIGNVIKRKRVKKNISQKELGAFLGLDKSIISRYEQGKVDMPVSNLLFISTYCEFPLTDYVYDEKVKMAVVNFELLLKCSQEEQADQEGVLAGLKEKLPAEYREMADNLADYLQEEGAEKITDILNSAGMLIRNIADEGFNREFSNVILFKVKEDFVQRAGRVNRTS